MTQQSAQQANSIIPRYSRLAMVLGAGTALIGIIGVTGIFLGISSLSSILPGTRPVSLAAALLWILLGIALVFMAKNRLGRYTRTCLTILFLVIAIVEIIEIPLSLSGTHFIIDLQIIQLSTLWGIQTTPISPVTAAMIVVAISGLLLLLNAPELSRKNENIRDVAGVIGTLVSFAGFVLVISYLYDAPLLNVPQFIPVSLPSALALFILGLGIAVTTGPESFPSRYFSGTSTRAQLLRTALPLVLVVILVDEFLHIGLTTYLQINDALQFALVVAIFIVITMIVVGRTADRVSIAIDSAEAKRRLAEQELRAAYEQLAAQEEELRFQYDELAETQKVIRQREQQYSIILQTAMDGFGLIDTRGMFLDVNDALCSMLGYSREELLTRSLKDIEEIESLEMIDRHMQEIIRNGRDRFETRYHRKDGRIIDVEVSVVYTGTPSAPFFTFHHDVTERHLSARALGQATKKLNLLNMLTFDDIQNSVFGMRGFLELAHMNTKDEKCAGYLSRLDILMKKITHSLEFAHSYQDMGMKSPRWQDVSQTFLVAISHLDFSRIKHRIGLDGLEIFADPLLEQVFGILAKNTLIHGNSTTEVFVTFEKSPDTFTLIYADNGGGIPDALKSAIFSRDFQKKKGLDLYLVREILEITGMSIQETGLFGEGVRYEITVPKEGYRFRNKEINS
jgi:PAS domain S-box-containing protein